MAPLYTLTELPNWQSFTPEYKVMGYRYRLDVYLSQFKVVTYPII